MAPKEKEAKEQMFMAERYFEQDSLNLALNGDGMYPGFLDVIDDYGMTQGANLSKYYAGICYLRMGSFNEAIDHLKSFNAKDQILGPMANGAIGDAYMELNQAAQAADYYMDAAESSDNEFTTPLFLMKAAWTYEILKDYKKALEIYERIKLNYPTSTEAREIDKYIARAKGMQ
jgi:tetratricopeptide (TPR) repeat protein